MKESNSRPAWILVAKMCTEQWCDPFWLATLGPPHEAWAQTNQALLGLCGKALRVSAKAGGGELEEALPPSAFFCCRHYRMFKNHKKVK